MTTADWAIVISLCSAVVSAGGFVWNVWSKFIFPKPKVQVSFSYMRMMVPGEQRGQLIQSENAGLCLSATNFGPIAVTLRNAVAKSNDKGKGFGLLNPLPWFPQYPGEFEDATPGPYSGGLPKKIEVGEEFTAFFTPDHQELARDEVIRVGFTDTFNRFHWAPARDLIKARKHIRAACDKAGKKYSPGND